MSFSNLARISTIVISLVLLPLICRVVYAAPVGTTGTSWQAELDANNRTLTYSYDHFGGYDIDEGDVYQSVSLDDTFSTIPGWEGLLRKALDDWGRLADINFVEVEDSGDPLGAPGAQGIIRFSSHPFSVPDAIAHAYLSVKSDQTEDQRGSSSAGDFHYSTNTNFPLTAEHLLTTASHELGHSLGMNHNLNPGSIMHPFSSVAALAISEHDQADIRALYLPLNSPPEVFMGEVLSTDHDWLALRDASADNRRRLLLTPQAHITTSGEQKTAVKGIGASLAIENYAFDFMDITLAAGSRIDTNGHNAYGIAAGDDNSIQMNGSITTRGYSADGVALLGGSSRLITGTESAITTFGDGANAIFMGVDYSHGKGHDHGNTVVANGIIHTYGGGGAGILYHDYSNIVLNGTISTKGIGAAGIGSAQASHVNVTITEDGSIATAGKWGFGVLMYGANVNVINMGRITTLGLYGTGIEMIGLSNEDILVNLGQIITEGTLAHGLRARVGGNRLFHYGSIATSGTDAVGILVLESDNQLDLVGDVSSEQAQAVRMGGYWHPEKEVVEQTDNIGNRLYVHGSPRIIGDIVNDGAADGATVVFGEAYDPDSDTFIGDPASDLVFDHNFSGRAWLADARAGNITLNGSNAFSRLDIRSDARLSGDGSVQGSVYNDGDINPGHTVGSFSIGGDYVQGAGGQLTVDIVSTVEYDKLLVNGSAILAGSLQARFLQSYAPAHGDRFTLVQAAALSGQLSSDLTNITPTLMPTIRFENTRLMLEIERDYQNSSLLSHLNTNQRALAAAINVGAGPATGDFDAVLTQIDALYNYSQVAAAFDEMSIKASPARVRSTLGIASARTANLAQLLGSVRADQVTGGQLPGEGMQRNELYQDGGVFFSTSTLIGDQDTSRKQIGYDLVSTVRTFGTNLLFDNDTVLGVFGGVHRTDADIDDAGSEFRISGETLGVFGTRQWGEVYVDAMISYGINRYENTRRIVLPALDRVARSTTHGNLFNFYAAMGRSVTLSDWHLEPYAFVQYFKMDIDGYSETGADSLDLSVGGQKTEVLQPGIGVRLFRTYTTSFGELTPSLLASVQRRYGDDEENLDVRLADGQTHGFNVASTGSDGDSGSIGAGLTADFKNNLSLELEYTAFLGDSDYRAHEALFRVRYEF